MIIADPRFGSGRARGLPVNDAEYTIDRCDTVHSARKAGLVPDSAFQERYAVHPTKKAAHGRKERRRTGRFALRKEIPFDLLMHSVSSCPGLLVFG